MTDVTMEKPDRDYTYTCQNCGMTWGFDALCQPINHFEERVQPGETVPGGECPVCYSLCTPNTRRGKQK